MKLRLTVCVFVLAMCIGSVFADNPDEKTVAVITKGSKVEYFWEVFYEGIKIAADELKVKPVYYGLYDPDDSHIPKYILEALDEKPDGLIVSITDPKLLKPSIEQAISMKIPTVATYAGYDYFEALGIKHFVGEDPYLTGVEIGKRLVASGINRLLCIRDVGVDISLTKRIDGIKDVFDKENKTVIVLMVRGLSGNTASATIATALAVDDKLDGVIALGSTVGTLTIAALKEEEKYGNISFVAAFDMTPQLKKALQAGKVLFVVSQQPFMQGYLSMRLAASPDTDIKEHLKALSRLFKHDFFPVGSIPYKNLDNPGPVIYTGPIFITADMIAQEPHFDWW